jgi:hypothetical protein
MENICWRADNVWTGSIGTGPLNYNDLIRDGAGLMMTRHDPLGLARGRQALYAPRGIRGIAAQTPLEIFIGAVPETLMSAELSWPRVFCRTVTLRAPCHRRC